MSRLIYSASVLAASLIFADGAIAGVVRTPAPVAGIGVGAVALIGMGYRALKNRQR